MADYNERFALSPAIRDRVSVAFFEDLTKELQKAAPADGEERKRQRIRQRWSERALGSADTLIVTVSRMVASSAQDAKIDLATDDKIADLDLKRLVGKAIDALANVELKAESEVLPV